MSRRHVTKLLALVVLGSLSVASPASAHGSAPTAPKPSNWKSELTSDSRPAEGVEVTVADDGRVELVNRGDHVVTVAGYGGEPYLMVTPEGIFENRLSPARYLNVEAGGTAEVPDEADVEAEPDWVHASNDLAVAWHDHRTHWMGNALPPTVREQPSAKHVVIDPWTIPLDIDGTSHELSGQLTWIPPPTLWPWLILVTATMIVAAFAAASSSGLRLVGFVVLMAGIMLAIGSSASVPQSPSSMAMALLIPGCVLVVGLCLPPRNNRSRGLIIAGAVGVGLVSAMTAGGYVTHSQLPTVLSAPSARVGVVVAFGLGVGLALGGLAQAYRSRSGPAVPTIAP